LPLGRCGADSFDGPVEHDSALGDHGNVLAEVLDHIELVRRKEDGSARICSIAQDLRNRVGTHRVEPGKGLVEDQQLGVVDERSSQLSPLLIAVGEMLDAIVKSIVKAESTEPMVCGCGCVRPGHAA
jgi:hypothetical protein